MPFHRDFLQTAKPPMLAALLVAGSIVVGVSTSESGGENRDIRSDSFVLAQVKDKADKAAAAKAAKAAKEAEPKGAETGICPPGKALTPPRGRGGKPSCV